MIKSTSDQEQLKLCSHCGEHKPIDQFRRRYAGTVTVLYHTTQMRPPVRDFYRALVSDVL